MIYLVVLPFSTKEAADNVLESSGYFGKVMKADREGALYQGYLHYQEREEDESE